MYEEKEPLEKEKKVKKKKERVFFQSNPKKTTKKDDNSQKINKTKKVISFRTDWTSILVKLAIFLLLAFFLIFIVTKIRGIADKNTFTSNMEKMKEAAYIYYKVDTHRSVSENEEVSLTLEDMIDGGFLKELKEKKNVCSKEYSYVSLKKTGGENYNLEVYLTCGGEAKTANYDVIYKNVTDSPEEETILYELERTVSMTKGYSCPSGYMNAGMYCISEPFFKTTSAMPKYKITPQKNTAARFKASGYEYEYTDPLETLTAESYKCSSGYDLIGSKCVKTIDPSYRTNNFYSCSSGTPSGSRCLYTTNANYTDEQAYCTKGSLINGNSCYVHKKYSIRCVTGSKDSTLNSCYTTYTAAKELSDWLFDSKVTYRASYEPKDTETRSYEYDYEKENGDIVYRKMIRKYIKVCDDGDESSGNICRHYAEEYEKRYCSGDYHLTDDESECYTITDARYRDISGNYKCPSGYHKKGTGSSTTCYKYENAIKTTSKTPYCPTGYDLTRANQCVKTINATKVESKINYSCPSGYNTRGSGKSTTCYKKTSTEAYYYCTSKEATLSGTRCIIPEKTTFLTYSCPLGYKLSGNTCYKETKESILATVNDKPSNSKETIWNKDKELKGWTWTGKTKKA